MGLGLGTLEHLELFVCEDVGRAQVRLSVRVRVRVRVVVRVRVEGEGYG